MKHLIVIVFLFLISSNTLSEEITIEINAFIDGKDHLIIKGNSLYWNHLDFAAVGLWNNRNEPTKITTYIDSKIKMNTYDWYPNWDDTSSKEVRHEAISSKFSELKPAIPSCELKVKIVPANARGSVRIAQSPKRDNDYTTIIEFDDNSIDGADFYAVSIIFQNLEFENTVSDNLLKDAIELDVELNKTYIAIKESMPAEFRAGLTALQNQWIKYRDKRCTFEAQLSKYRKNWIAQEAIGEKDLGCIIDLTKQRINELSLYPEKLKIE